MIGIQDGRLTYIEIEFLLYKIQSALGRYVYNHQFLPGKPVKVCFNNTEILARYGTGDKLKGGEQTKRLNLINGNVRYQITWGTASVNGSDMFYSRALKTTRRKVDRREVEHMEALNGNDYRNLIEGFPRLADAEIYYIFK